MRCEELERADVRLKRQLDTQRQNSSAGPSHDADRLAELEQQNARLRQRLAGVQAAAAMTQATDAAGAAPQQQQAHHQQQQPHQQPQQLSLDGAVPEAADARDDDRASTDTTRAICTLPGALPEDAGPAQPSLQEPQGTPPASPARIQTIALAEEHTPCSRPPAPPGAAGGGLATATICRNLSLDCALQHSRGQATADQGPTAAVPAGDQEPAPRAAIPARGRVLKGTPASSPPAQRSSRQQHRQQAQPQTEVRKGWRQKRKAGGADDMLASQKAASRLRPGQQPAAQPPKQPPAPLPQPAAPDSLACTPPEQRQAAADPALLTAPDTVAWSSPAKPAQQPQQQTHAPAQQQLQRLQTASKPAAARAPAPPDAVMPPPARLAPWETTAGPAAIAGPPMRPGDARYKFTAVVRRKAERELMQVRSLVATDYSVMFFNSAPGTLRFNVVGPSRIDICVHSK